MRPLLIAMMGLLVAGGPGASDAEVVCVVEPPFVHCVINNGLAPPNLDNVIAGVSYFDNWVYVRNVGCPPGWPAADAYAACPSPGTATEVALVDDGRVAWLLPCDSSIVTVSGGTVEEVLAAYDSSIVTVSGGTVDDLLAFDSSHITISGGLVNNYLLPYQDSIVTWKGGTMHQRLAPFDTANIAVVGRDFRVDGVPVPYGDLTEQTGTLTGTLDSGDPINNVFYQGGWTGSPCSAENPCTGTITLVAPPVLCGNGLIDATEECDDGDTVPSDGCDATCQVEVGWICLGEPSVCSVCGDGAILGLEQCDDGDATPGDGCNASCQIETGWICEGEPSVCTEHLLPTLSPWSQLALMAGLLGAGLGVWRGRAK